MFPEHRCVCRVSRSSTASCSFLGQGHKDTDSGIQHSYRTVKHTSAIMEHLCVYPVWHKSGWGREPTWPWWVRPLPLSGPPSRAHSTTPWSPATLLEHKLKELRLEPCRLGGNLSEFCWAITDLVRPRQVWSSWRIACWEDRSPLVLKNP